MKTQKSRIVRAKVTFLQFDKQQNEKVWRSISSTPMTPEAAQKWLVGAGEMLAWAQGVSNVLIDILEDR